MRVKDFAQAQCLTMMVGARPGDARVVYASLSRLLPELGDGALAAKTDDHARLSNAVAAVLESPALEFDAFAFDDLHFADDASVALLQVVAAGSQRRGLVAARAVEVSIAGRAWLDGLHADTAALRLKVPPLTVAQTELLLQSLDIEGVDARALALQLLRHSGGNPMFLLETIKAWLTQGGDTTLGRFRRVGEPCFAMPRRAEAMLPQRPFSWRVLAVFWPRRHCWRPSHVGLDGVTPAVTCPAGYARLAH